MQSYINAGLPKAKAESTAKNEKLAIVLDKIISNAEVTDASKNPKQGNLLLHLATTAQELAEEDQTMLASLVKDGSIQSVDQLNGEIGHPPSITSLQTFTSSLQAASHTSKLEETDQKRASRKQVALVSISNHTRAEYVHCEWH